MSDFELDGNRLKVSGDLEAMQETELREHCATLFLEAGETVRIDLTQVESISSVCIGALVTLWIDLCAAGRRIELKASPAVEKVLNMAGLDVLLGR